VMLAAWLCCGAQRDGQLRFPIEQRVGAAGVSRLQIRSAASGDGWSVSLFWRFLDAICRQCFGGLEPLAVYTPSRSGNS